MSEAAEEQTTTIGGLLSAAREGKGVAVADLAAATCIRGHHLEALERDDLDSLPGDVFVRGYLRACATFLDADGEAWVACYDLQREGHGGGDDTVIRDMSRMLHVDEAVRQRRKRLLIVSLALTVLVAAAGGWWVSRRDAAPVDPVATAPTPTPTETPTPTPTPASLGTPAPVPVPAGATDRSQEEPAATVELTRAKPSPPETTAAPPTAMASTTRTVETAPATTEVVIVPVPSMEWTADAPSELRVEAHGVGSGIANRNLVGEADRFPAGSRVVFWNRLLGGSDGERIEHVWLRDGLEVDRISLRIGGAHWRTHSLKTLYGEVESSWAVETRSAAGEVLARTEFVATR